MSYNAGNIDKDTTIVQEALDIANGGCQEIGLILSDIQGVAGTTDKVNILGDSGTGTVGVMDTGKDVLDSYKISNTADITTAAGAMVIDDLMQKISTKVQVAAQLLSTANNICKTASRIMSQG